MSTELIVLLGFSVFSVLLIIIEYHTCLRERDGDKSAAIRNAMGWGAAYTVTGLLEYVTLLA